MSNGASNNERAGWVRVGVEWDPQGLATVRQAAAILGVPLEVFVKSGAEAEALRVIKTRGGWVDIPTAAERIGVPRGQIISMIGSGQLVAKKIEGDWLIDGASLETLRVEQGADEMEQIELDLQQLVQTNGLQGLELDGEAPLSLSLSWCYVTQAGVLVSPRALWRRLGREKVVGEAREAVRRHLRRDERSL
jgi:hypothetical protein